MALIRDSAISVIKFWAVVIPCPVSTPLGHCLSWSTTTTRTTGPVLYVDLWNSIKMSGSVSQLFVNCSSSLPFLQLRCPGTAADKSTLLVRHELFRAESLFRDHFQAGCAQRWQCPAGRRGGELVIYIHDPAGRVIINSHYHRPLVSLCSTTPHVHLCSVPISGVQMPSGLPEFPNEESPDQFDRYWWVVPHECNSLRPSEFRTVKSSRKVGLQRPLNDTLIGLLEIKI